MGNEFHLMQLNGEQCIDLLSTSIASIALWAVMYGLMFYIGIAIINEIFVFLKSRYDKNKETKETLQREFKSDLE